MVNRMSSLSEKVATQLPKIPKNKKVRNSNTFQFSDIHADCNRFGRFLTVCFFSFVGPLSQLAGDELCS